ncbi:MAG: preprotein translocase subunit YajC [Verrucomicrobia bacterium]|nr:preprotein translocase subunit YajC [Verrucomicrobiota bacterium]
MMDMNMIVAMAPPAGGQGGGLGMFLPMILIFAIFYFMLIRPQQRKEKERRALIDNIKSGERIMFSGGIIGTVANVKETTFVVKIADNVKIEVARGAVSRVLEKGEKVADETSA